MFACCNKYETFATDDSRTGCTVLEPFKQFKNGLKVPEPFEVPDLSKTYGYIRENI